MNLLDISHFGHGKNVGMCIKQLLARVHGGILWMDRPVLIDVALITKITGFPTVGAQPKEYLENKVCEKEIANGVLSSNTSKTSMTLRRGSPTS
jgi:hypothetical protein